MNWDAVTGIAEIIGVVLVFLSLIYVAMQIRQNTQVTRDQSTRSLMLATTDATGDVARDGELADILMRGTYNRGELDPGEMFRFNCFFFSYYNQVDYAYEQYLAGKLDIQSWDKIAQEIPVYIGAPGIREWWSEDKIRFTPPFFAFVESILDEHPSMSKLPSIPSPDEVQNGT